MQSRLSLAHWAPGTGIPREPDCTPAGSYVLLLHLQCEVDRSSGLLGLLASGGSGLWNQALDIARATKVSSESVAQAAQAKG